MTPDLWKLREWLTISQAAEYLSSKIDDDVSEADILRLGLDGQLKLSVNLPSGTKGWFHREGTDTSTRPTSMTRIDGLWDLLMTGAGKQQVEHDYHYKAHLPYVSLDGAGAWVERAGERRQLEPYRGSTGISTRAASALSESGVLAVRVSALDELAAQMPAPPVVVGAEPLDEKPLIERERLSLLRIIRALAKEAQIDISQASKAAQQIEALTAAFDDERVASTTIARHLRRIRETLGPTN